MLGFQLNQQRMFYTALAAALLVGCSLKPPKPSSGHLSSPMPTTPNTAVPAVVGDIPKTLIQAPFLPPPSAQEKAERYTVVVNDVPVDELLFALARDAKLNIDIVGDISGRVTLNAIDQTLMKILERLSLQAPIRYQLQLDQKTLLIEADAPYLSSYRIDYLNVARRSSSSISLATEIGSLSSTEDGGSNASGNNSRTRLTNASDNSFWQTLTENIYGILGKPLSSSDEAQSTDVIVNRETGLVTVRATHRQHKEVQSYINKVLSSARRQVLIEATVVEVNLNDSNETGIDWRVLTKKNNSTSGIDFAQLLLPGAPTAASTNLAPTTALLTVRDPGSSSGSVTATIKALQEFGDVQILSSPKIIALNNQPAVLKVVDNRVYFTTRVERTDPTQANPSTQTTFETELHTVPIGLVMSVTPFISANEEIVLNVRPTISRILSFVNDPNPELAEADVQSRVPEIQVREMESMLRVNSGQIAVIGGLMQDSVKSDQAGVPGLSDVPVLGRLFSSTKDEVTKTELMVFLRPTVIKNASLSGDFKEFGRYLNPQKPEHSKTLLDGGVQ